jgi:hypothetical protein
VTFFFSATLEKRLKDTVFRDEEKLSVAIQVIITPIPGDRLPSASAQ